MSRKIPLTPIERENLVWRKAQASTANGDCVELAPAGGKIAMRDSKDPSGPILLYTPTEFISFLDGAKRGEFDDLVS